MNILITAPSLNPSQNVSGVSSMVNNIINNNLEHSYFHYLLGRPDQISNNFTWIIQLVRQFILFPVFLKRNKIELVHQNLPLDPKGILREYVINKWCQLVGVPVVLHIHGGIFMTHEIKNLLLKKMVHSLFRYSKHVIVLSEIEKELLIGKFNFTTSKILSNCIDLPIYNVKQIKILNERPNLLFLGRIEKNKGIVEVIEALKLLKMELNFRFILCGTGPLTKYCIHECKMILGNDFEYRGVVSGEVKNETIKQAHLFILPSYFEGLPLALIETMAGGVVPIVTNAGSMKYIVRHGINGMHINKQDPQDLYRNLKIILSDNSLFESLSKEAKNTVTDQYDIRNYIIQLNKIYSSARIDNKRQTENRIEQ